MIAIIRCITRIRCFLFVGECNCTQHLGMRVDKNKSCVLSLNQWAIIIHFMTTAMIQFINILKDFDFEADAKEIECNISIISVKNKKVNIEEDKNGSSNVSQ